MTQLKVEVFFQTQGTEHSVALTTLVNTLATSSATGAGTSGGSGLP